ncbi:hypothetical protein [Methylorubrum extorquens]
MPRAQKVEAGPMPLYPSEDRILAELYGAEAASAMSGGWDGVAKVLERDGLPKRDPPAFRQSPLLARRRGLAPAPERSSVHYGRIRARRRRELDMSKDQAPGLEWRA